MWNKETYLWESWLEQRPCPLHSAQVFCGASPSGVSHLLALALSSLSFDLAQLSGCQVGATLLWHCLDTRRLCKQELGVWTRWIWPSFWVQPTLTARANFAHVANFCWTSLVPSTQSLDSAFNRSICDGRSRLATDSWLHIRRILSISKLYNYKSKEVNSPWRYSQRRHQL